jgi:hypothetical protein
MVREGSALRLYYVYSETKSLIFHKQKFSPIRFVAYWQQNTPKVKDKFLI